MTLRHLSTRLEGGICGPIWWPVGAMCGKPLSVDLKRESGRFVGEGHTTLRCLLLHVQMEHGGDFQSASFTADSEIVVTFRAGSGRTVTRRRPLSAFASVSDLTTDEAYSWGFGDTGDDD